MKTPESPNINPHQPEQWPYAIDVIRQLAAEFGIPETALESKVYSEWGDDQQFVQRDERRQKRRGSTLRISPKGIEQLRKFAQTIQERDQAGKKAAEKASHWPVRATVVENLVQTYGVSYGFANHRITEYTRSHADSLKEIKAEETNTLQARISPEAAAYAERAAIKFKEERDASPGLKPGWRYLGEWLAKLQKDYPEVKVGTLYQRCNKYLKTSPSSRHNVKPRPGPGHALDTYQISSKLAAYLEQEAQLLTKKGPKLRPDWRYRAEALQELAKEAKININSLTASAKKLAREFPDETGPVEKKPGQASNRQISPTFYERLREIAEGLPKIKDTVESVITSEMRESTALVELGKTLEQEITLGQKSKLLQLIQLFGSSRATVLLFRTHPQFQGLPMDRVKSSLADHMGNFLISSGSLNFLETPEPELVESLASDAEFSEALLQNLKEYCHRAVVDRSKSYTTTPSLAVVTRLNEIEEVFSAFGPQTREMLKDLREYFSRVLKSGGIPNMVKQLGDNRPFPDYNQQVNMTEIEQHGRVVIADKMGAGKSASAIFSKEKLLGKDKLALVICPSDVISTWQKYLSSEIKPTGEQVGYFRPEQEPVSFAVRGLEDWNRIPADCEYLIVSQQMLRPETADKLLALDYDMIIADEIHKLKNIKRGKRSKELLRLCNKLDKPEQYVALLSGTPAPNKVSDIAILLKILYPDRFKDTPDKELVTSIIRGDIADLQALLLPRTLMKDVIQEAELPEIERTETHGQLSDVEQEIYQVILEEDELSFTEKLNALLKFVLNPQMLEATPDLIGSKAKMLKRELVELFEQNDKVVVFVNKFAEQLIRGKRNLISLLDQIEPPFSPPPKILTIHGKNVGERDRIREEFNNGQGKYLLFAMGEAAGVGIDLSGGNATEHYVEPWTMDDLDQQIKRVHRPGAQGKIRSGLGIMDGTIEEVHHAYVLAKKRAIDKLFHGIQLTELEQRLLLSEEESDNAQDLESSSPIAMNILSAMQRLQMFFGATKEKGQEKFFEFLKRYGEEYASTYEDLGSRSYQANAARVTGKLIEQIALERGINPATLQVLDSASGPEMLRRHAPDEMKNITSLDANAGHFANAGPEPRAVQASFLQTPFSSEKFDVVNFSFALHYTTYLVKQRKRNLERFNVLAENNRVLKPGGHLILNMIYSLNFKNPEHLPDLFKHLGFKMIEKYSGEVSAPPHYLSTVYALEKVGLPTPFEKIPPELIHSLKFLAQEKRLRDSSRVIDTFSLNGQKFEINFNEADQLIHEEEKSILEEAKQLIAKNNGNIKNIPSDELLGLEQGGFSRIRIGQKYILIKKLTTGPGSVVVRGS